MKLTATERRSLRAYARTRSWANVHGRTIHALERKGLIGFIRGRRNITPTGQAELVVPDIFDDLFEKKESTMPDSKKSSAKQSRTYGRNHASTAQVRNDADDNKLSAKQALALARLRTVTDIEIDAHLLLTDEQKKLCKIFRDKATKDGDEFTMLDFAQIVLRATGCDYAASVTDHQTVVHDASHRRAAIIYVYEALRAVDAPIITEWPEFDEMLKCLVTLADELP